MNGMTFIRGMHFHGNSGNNKRVYSMKVVFHYSSGPNLSAELASLGQQGLLVEQVAVEDKPGFARAMQDCEVLWHVLEPITSEHINAAPNLKLIQKIGVGVNTIDVAAAEAQGIAVCNMPGTNSQAVAEMTLLLMLSALRQVSYFDPKTRQGTGWDFTPDIQDSLGEISGKTVGFVGFGEIPQRLAPILKAMGARIIYTATTEKKTDIGEFQGLDQVLNAADILSLHIPLTPETTNLIDASAFDKMKSGSVLVNTSRGGVVDQEALINALKFGPLRAAGLDVYAREPVLKDDALLKLDNVTLTPHIAWLTSETLKRSIGVAVENCIRLQDGKELLHQVPGN
jgi:phosphoglycerate dehydrogenase-like enzyme